jgi:hypothetical protein
LWWRNRKWWWSVWIWLFGVVCTNAFVIYKANCKKNNAVPMTHLDFLERLCDEMSGGKLAVSVRLLLQRSANAPGNHSPSFRPRVWQALHLSVYHLTTERDRHNRKQMKGRVLQKGGSLRSPRTA